MPRMLPRFNVLTRSDAPRWDLFRIRVPCGVPAANEADEPPAGELLMTGCRICWLLMAPYMSWFHTHERLIHLSNKRLRP